VGRESRSVGACASQRSCPSKDHPRGEKREREDPVYLEDPLFGRVKGEERLESTISSSTGGAGRGTVKKKEKSSPLRAYQRLSSEKKTKGGNNRWYYRGISGQTHE